MFKNNCSKVYIYKVLTPGILEITPPLLRSIIKLPGFPYQMYVSVNVGIPSTKHVFNMSHP